MKIEKSLQNSYARLRLSADIKEDVPPFFVRNTGWALSLLALSFLLWTAFAEVEEIIYAPGEVVPIGFSQTIQHYDGGIVSEILVQEGSKIQKGDIMLKLDGTSTKKDLKKAIILLQAYEQRLETAGELFKIQENLKKSGVSSTAQYIKILQSMNDAKSNLESQKEVVFHLEERVARLQVKAPVSGLVKGFNINTIGAVIQSGGRIMNVVPFDRPLVVEAHISPSDIGQIKKGQNVRLKISAFDFAHYGALDGTLDLITATTFQDKNGQRYYRARILLEKDYLTKGNEHVKILPGMIVEIGVITGKKTIFSYLFKPIHRAFKNSLHEK